MPDYAFRASSKKPGRNDLAREIKRQEQQNLDNYWKANKQRHELGNKGVDSVFPWTKYDDSATEQQVDRTKKQLDEGFAKSYIDKISPSTTMGEEGVSNMPVYQRPRPQTDGGV